MCPRMIRIRMMMNKMMSKMMNKMRMIRKMKMKMRKTFQEMDRNQLKSSNQSLLINLKQVRRRPNPHKTAHRDKAHHDDPFISHIYLK